MKRIASWISVIFVFISCNISWLSGQSLTITPNPATFCTGREMKLIALPNPPQGSGNDWTEIKWERKIGPNPNDWEALPFGFQGANTFEVTASQAIIDYNGYIFRVKAKLNDNDIITSDEIQISIKNSFNFVYLVASPPQPCPDSLVKIFSQPDVTTSPFWTLKWFQWDGSNWDEHTDQQDKNPLEVNIAALTKFRAIAEGMCGDTAEIEVPVVPAPDPYTSVSFSPDPPCEGEPVTLTASGGMPSTGTGAWYSDAGFTNKVGTGNSLNISSATTATYYVRRETVCPGLVSGAISKAITPVTQPEAEILPFDSLVCKGASVSFSAADMGSNVIYEWTFQGGSPNEASGKGPVEVTYNQIANNRLVSLSVKKGNCATTFTDQGTIDVIDAPDLNIIPEDPLQEPPVFELLDQSQLSLMFETENPVGLDISWACELKSGAEVVDLPRSGTGDLFSEVFSFEDPNSDMAEISCEAIAEFEDCPGIAKFSILLRRLMFIPNVLSPNGDAFNETWNIEFFSFGSGEPGEGDFNIQLFNRMGHCVKGCKETFDLGMAREWSGEDCPPGAYWYIISNEDAGSSTPVRFTGSLTIIHNN